MASRYMFTFGLQNRILESELVIVVATLSIAAFGSTSIALAQNTSGGTPEKSKSITQGLSPNSTTATG
jgi:hypothetical protein